MQNRARSGVGGRWGLTVPEAAGNGSLVHRPGCVIAESAPSSQLQMRGRRHRLVLVDRKVLIKEYKLAEFLFGVSIVPEAIPAVTKTNIKINMSVFLPITSPPFISARLVCSQKSISHSTVYEFHLLSQT